MNVDIKEYHKEAVKKRQDKKLAKMTVTAAGTSIAKLKYELTSIINPSLKREFWRSKGISNSMAYLIVKHLF
jgi:hypothetical protein